MVQKNISSILYPEDKDFIFTIFDDTDVSTLEYIKPIYDYLADRDIKTTKSVWPLSNDGDSDYKGSHTLEDQSYAQYVRGLCDQGFEIGYHGPTMVSSERKDIIRSLKKFVDIIGIPPRIYAPHSLNRENLYWGSARFSIPLFRILYQFISQEPKNYYQGHIESSSYFWGDLSLQYLDYVRGFTFRDINLLKIIYKLPYTNPLKPLVKFFFFTCDADNVEDFNSFVSLKNQERLERERGVCIISTHFGKGFIHNRQLHYKTKCLLDQISKRNGWFVPVSTVLDFLRNQQSDNIIKYYELIIFELKWLLHSVVRGKSSHEYKKTEIPYLQKSQ